MKCKPAHRSSFRQAAIKAGIFAAAVFFAAHTVFGKPAPPLAGASDYPWPSISASDTIRSEAGAIYARLSPQSRQFLSSLCSQVNRSGEIPGGYFYPETLALQALAKWGRSFSESPQSVLEALKDAEKYAHAFRNRGEADRIAHMNAAAQLQFFLALYASAPEQQKALLGEAFRTYVVPPLQ